MSSEVDIDNLLKDWPDDDGADRLDVDVVVNAARTADAVDEAELDAMTQPPSLEAEPGEPTHAALPAEVAASASPPTSRRSMSESQRPKRQSLKELAERHSKAPPSRASVTPLPAASVPPSSVTATPLPSTRAIETPVPSVRPPESSEDDSGILDLGEINKKATDEEKKAAEKAQPATHDLVDGAPDAAPSTKKSAQSKKPAAAAAAKVESKPSNTNTYIGVAVGVFGIAAAFAIVAMDRGEKPAGQSASVTSETTLEAPAATGEELAAAPKPRERPSGGVDLNSLPGAEDDAAEEDGEEDEGASAVGGPLPTGALAKAEDDDDKGEKKDPAATDKPLPDSKGEDDGNLADAISEAAGADGSSDDKAVPAADNPKSSSGKVPTKPSQGKVAAAMGGVMGGAKACVAGAPDVSRATITFGSSGAVQSVSVSGWAAGKGAAGCIKSALSGANVGPFSDPSYTFGVTVRP